MRFPYSLQPEVLDQPGNVNEAGAYVGGQFLQLRVHNVIQGLYSPRHSLTPIIAFLL
jgi:hypothetical protein